ncbi:MAG: indole-3-glycerol phosphate synthase TrpC [bacterium]
MNALDRILARVRERLPAQIAAHSFDDVQRAAEAAPPRPSFREAVERAGTSVIAEVKHASPSRGVLRDPFDPVELATAYRDGGARAISVLTEPDFFGGSPDHLRAVRDRVDLPILRKDFLLDPYQIYEARAWGASAILLIVAAVETSRLEDLLFAARSVGLDALVEVHTPGEAEEALRAGARLVGINNRDLTTFRTDRATTATVASVIGGDATIVSESGIFTRADVLEVEAAGASAVLVGEALVTSADPRAKVAELTGEEPA